MYKFLLFIHVFATIVMMGPTFVLPATMKMRGEPPNPAVMKIEYVIERYVTWFVVVQLVTGIGLISTSPVVKDNFGDQHWLHLAIALFVVYAGLGTGLAHPRMRKALKAAEAGDGGEVHRLMDPLDRIVGPVLGVLAAVIVYLMLIKPDF
jgi:uncharacterized membrane protein